MSSFDRLRVYLEARAAFAESEFEMMKSIFVPMVLRSGEFLQRAGEVARHAAFVAVGCMRMYAIDSNGKEHIVQFAPEDWWLSDSASLMTKAPSQYFIDAIEDSEVLLLDPPSHQKLLERIPGYAAAFQAGLQKHAAAKDRRIINSLSSSAEERYLHFMETYPSIALRVPQRMVASYLGITPETVSRIRKNLSRK